MCPQVAFWFSALEMVENQIEFKKIWCVVLSKITCITFKLKHTLIEIFWSDLTFKQQSSRIYRFAGTPVLVMSRPEWQIMAVCCLNVKYDQKVSFSVNIHITYFHINIIFNRCLMGSTDQAAVTTSEFHEYWWNDHDFISLSPPLVARPQK